MLPHGACSAVKWIFVPTTDLSHRGWQESFVRPVGDRPVALITMRVCRHLPASRSCPDAHLRPLPFCSQNRIYARICARDVTGHSETGRRRRREKTSSRKSPEVGCPSGSRHGTYGISHAVATGATVNSMSSQPEITQRDLRMRSKEIMDAVERGQAFTVTRDGHRIGELVPLRQRRRFVSRTEFAAMSRSAPVIDADAFRADQDTAADQAGSAYDR